MSQNITWLGASYSDVPAVTLPKTGGGTARFSDTTPTTATASDVASGKIFFDASGTITTGTGSGGGDSLIVTLSWDDDYFGADEGAWVPDCTFAEIQAAYLAGKTIAVRTDVYADAYCSDIDMPTWLTYEVAAPAANKVLIYELNSNSLQLLDEIPIIVPNFDSPTRTYTPTTSQQTDTITYDPNDGYNGIEQVSVTVNAMPTGTAGTPTATKGAVSNHAVSVTPSVTNTTGYITGGTLTGTAVNVTAAELVSGSQTITENSTVDVTNLASVVVDVQGSAPSLHVGTASYTDQGEGALYISDLAGEPTSFAVIAHGTHSPSGEADGVAFVYDGTNDMIGQSITNTTGAQVSYLASAGSFIYSNGMLAIYPSVSGQTSTQYSLVYTYGGGAIDTKQVQVGSGATSITFTGLEDEPACWYVIFQSNFSTSSGYQRVIAVADNGSDTYGLEMDSSAHYSDQHWTSSYSNGSLTITSQGTNAGGYFHQPGTYLLVYAYDASGNYQSKTVTPSQSTQEVTADSGYDALRKVTVNPIPSEYIVPTGNIAITSNTASGQSVNVSQYATATVNVPTGGGSVNVASTTWTNNSTSTVSHQFTGLKGTPKFAVLRCTAQLTRSSSNTYYYIADIVWDGTDAWGNYHLRSNGSLNNVAKDAASGFNVTVSGSSITFSSDATSRSSAPGSFYNSTYELTYVY